MSADKRRYGVIEVRFRPGPPALYQLTIAGERWAAVEWSPSRRAWCIEDAAGHCLAHCEHIHGENIDQRTALALAKAMIRDGRMPTPEEAQRQLEASHEHASKPPGAGRPAPTRSTGSCGRAVAATPKRQPFWHQFRMPRLVQANRIEIELTVTTR
jgi:hypothetical protein